MQFDAVTKPLTSGAWSTDTDEAFGDHNEAAGQSVDVVVINETPENLENHGRPLVVEPEEHDPMMGTGWMHPQISEADVKSDQHSLFALSSVHDLRVGRTNESLACDGVDVVATPRQHSCRFDGDVLVELEPHELGNSDRTSCLASQAPYAAAALTPNSSMVG